MGETNETQTWYEVDHRGVTPVEVLRETEHFVVLRMDWRRSGEMRQAKRSPDGRNGVFPTEREAVAFRRDHLTRAVEAARTSLERAERHLAEFNAKHPPEAP